MAKYKILKDFSAKNSVISNYPEKKYKKGDFLIAYKVDNRLITNDKYDVTDGSLKEVPTEKRLEKNKDYVNFQARISKTKLKLLLIISASAAAAFFIGYLI